MLGLARLCVGRWGVGRARHLAARLAPASRLSPERLDAIVRAVGRWVPGLSRCLPRAITLEALLVGAGHAAELRVGLAPREGRERPGAHAWVELDGVAVGEDPSGFTALPLFGTRA